jgi:hypothetical protein
MASHLHLDADARVYFALTCDRYQARFASYDVRLPGCSHSGTCQLA